MASAVRTTAKSYRSRFGLVSKAATIATRVSASEPQMKPAVLSSI